MEKPIALEPTMRDGWRQTQLAGIVDDFRSGTPVQKTARGSEMYWTV